MAQIKQDRDSKATEFGEVRRKADATITGLKRDLSEVQRDSNARIQSLNSQMAERGKAQSDLAPWIALADSWYSNAPPDQRLDLLLKRVSELTNTVPGAGRDARAQTPRVLSAEAMARIRAKLNFLSLLSQQKMTVEIQSLGGDPESLALAGQIKTLFEGYGLEIKNGVQEAVREKPLNGLVLESNHPLEGGPLADAMFQLFKELDGPPAVLINPKLSDSQLIIEAGSNQ